MEFDHLPAHIKRGTLGDEATERGDDDQYERKSAGKKSHENGCTEGDHLTEIPVNCSWGTHVMGDPAKPAANSNIYLAATWVAPQLMPANTNVKLQAAESPGGHTDHKTRGLNHPPVGVHDKPPVPLCPYVLNGNTATSTQPGKRQMDAIKERLNRCCKNADDLAENFCSHMKLGSSMSETVKGKLSLAAHIVKEGGVENLFKQSFSVGPTEKLLKASACYLSTTTGPVAGLLFISTENLAFCSDRPLSFTCPEGGIAWSYYRILIPLGRVSSVKPFENEKKPAEKYIQILTVDNHEFWFMGFVNFHKAFKRLQEAVRSR